MKVTNITNETGSISQDVRLPFLRKDGSNINLTLKSGEYTYIEHKGNNSILRLYEKKRILKITQEDLPENYSYYKVYNNISIVEKVKKTLKTVVKIFTKEEDVSAIEEIHDISLKEELTSTLAEESSADEPIEVEIIVPEDSVEIKNKGGRPKGSKNKSKRGRPKAKKQKKRTKK
jgi:hypothetical protein